MKIHDLTTATAVRNFYRSLDPVESRSALPYVYAAFHKRTMDFYFGFRCANRLPAQNDLGFKYFSSSTTVRNDPDAYYFAVLRIFRSKDVAYRFEQRLIKEHIENPKCFNRHWQTSGSYTMLGMKRPDLALLNSQLKTVERIQDSYVCKWCAAEFTMERTIGQKRRERKFCGKSCAKFANPQIGCGKRTNISKTAWNKGLPNPQAAANARAGAAKLAEHASNRRMAIRPDGTRYWKQK